MEHVLYKLSISSIDMSLCFFRCRQKNEIEGSGCWVAEKREWEGI
jgi:hypothetical protein